MTRKVEKVAGARMFSAVLFPVANGRKIIPCPRQKRRKAEPVHLMQCFELPKNSMTKLSLRGKHTSIVTESGKLECKIVPHEHA